MATQLKIPISFKENEKYIYNHIKSHFNFSAYIKELVLRDMQKNKCSSDIESRGAVGGISMDF